MKCKLLGSLQYLKVKGRDKSDTKNYRPISGLPCFSIILEKIMCNRFYKHLINNSIFCKKQVDFQENRSTEHAII